MTMREFIDSREGFSSDEQEAYHSMFGQPFGWECVEGDDVEPTDEELAAAPSQEELEEDYEEMDAMFAAMDMQDLLDDDEDENFEDDEFDGQPDEAQEWFDYDPDC